MHNNGAKMVFHNGPNKKIHAKNQKIETLEKGVKYVQS